MTTKALADVAKIHINHINHSNQSIDQVIVEEPLQISLQWQEGDKEIIKPWLVTMRTPGMDTYLIRGLLINQGVIDSLCSVQVIQDYDDHTTWSANHQLVIFTPDTVPKLAQSSRHQVSHSSCGICGINTLKGLQLTLSPCLDTASHWLKPERVKRLVNELKEQQVLFAATGAVHGIGYWSQGDWQCVMEDVGRHNALDKVTGYLLTHERWHPQGVLVLSGRVSFELMQKALVTGVCVIIAVGAPSSLAIQVAQRFDLTLIGFTRSETFNVYHAPWRLKQ
ncbi:MULTISPECIES: formate dehydrogenase accessory sulfurtransferase FdhD [unclassified Vibrio]|uniref:Sulfur carrier protein FdhD n=1 Tax=Vibrio sp. HB236076 TaxID=3232307 RepID=A0AB39HJI3_9VIBR|nr:formate dehydrogenase accessory sulfurtransferase FdhD [Vibrio sp. HB161653]MDP5253064.1 formate dehydrogenase accessory sulfurtransferase FdhD [Vibrio sp. HB161653]